jgi:hypothetical protein
VFVISHHAEMNVRRISEDLTNFLNALILTESEQVSQHHNAPIVKMAMTRRMDRPATQAFLHQFMVTEKEAKLTWSPKVNT